MDNTKIRKFYINGRSIIVDVKNAMWYFISSANQGNALAQYCLGESYLDGSIGEVDKYKAKIWFQKAAAQGEQHAIEALNNLK